MSQSRMTPTLPKQQHLHARHHGSTTLWGTRLPDCAADSTAHRSSTNQSRRATDVENPQDKTRWRCHTQTAGCCHYERGNSSRGHMAHCMQACLSQSHIQTALGRMGNRLRLSSSCAPTETGSKKRFSRLQPPSSLQTKQRVRHERGLTSSWDTQQLRVSCAPRLLQEAGPAQQALDWQIPVGSTLTRCHTRTEWH